MTASKLIYYLEDDNPSTDVDGVHAGRLPGVDCPVCGPWGTAGVAYPTLKFEKTFAGKAKSTGSLELEQYNANRDAFKRAVGPDAFDSRLWKPSSAVGQFSGTGKGKKPGDIMIPDFTFSLFVEETAYARLQPLFLLIGEPAEIKWNSRSKWAQTDPLRFIEVEIPPSLALSSDEHCTICELCGRVEGAREPLSGVLADSFDPRKGLYRGCLATTALYCSRDFLDRYHEMGLTGLKFHPVPLV